MFKTLNKWIKTSTPWQTIFRFLLVLLISCTSLVAFFSIITQAPPAQAATACVPNIFYASEYGGPPFNLPNSRLFAIDLATGNTTTVGTLATTTLAISRDAITGKVFYIADNNATGGTGPFQLYSFDPTTGTNQPIGSGIGSPASPTFLKMAQDQNGNIYAADGNNNIFKIDKTLGTVSLAYTAPAAYAAAVTQPPLPYLGIPPGSGDIAFDPNNANILYLTQQDPLNNPNDLYLWKIDFSSGTPNILGAVRINGIFPASGSLAFAPDGSLKFDTFNGTTTVVHSIPSSTLASAGFSNTVSNIINTSGSFTLSGPAAANGIADFGTLPSLSPNITMDVAKSASNAAVVPGSPITYTIRVSNQGSCDAKGVKLQDVLIAPPAPAPLQSASWSFRVAQISDETATGTGTMTPASGSGNIDAIVSLNVGSRLIVTVTGTVVSPAPASISNTATLITDRFITSTVTTPVIPGVPDLEILKTGSSTYTPGSNITYSLQIRNNSPTVAATNVTLNDPSPPGATFVSLSGSACTPVVPPTPFPCSLGTLIGSATRNLSVTYAISASTGGALSNTAEVVSPDEPPGLLRNNNKSTFVSSPPSPPVVVPPIVPPVVDVAIGVSAPPSVPPGSNFTVTLTASNVGTITADNVVVSYDVPARVMVVSVPSGCVYNASASTIVCATIPSFGRGATASYDFVFKAPDTPTTLTGIARISTTSPEPNTGNNSAAATTTVATGAPTPTLPPGVVIPPGGTTPPATPAPSVLGSALQANPPVNNRDGTETVTFTLTITNTGTQTLNNIQAILDLVKTFSGVQNFAILSINSSDFLVNSSFNGMDLQNLLANGNVLTPGATGKITFSVRVTPGFNLGPYFASVTVQGTDPNGVRLTDISTNGTVPDANANGTPSDDSTPTTIQFTGLPNVRLVKRMTNASRNGVALTNISFNAFVDDPSDSNDNAPGWSALSPVGLSRISETGLLQSGDALEYTVYFLSDGTGVASNFLLCDPIPVGATFLPDTYSTGQGISLRLNGADTVQTNAADSDAGRFISILSPAPSPCASSNNRNGSVFVQIPVVSNRSPNNAGFVRFQVRID